MKIFSSNDVLRLAKRLNNSKRNFLLVNPLQAKHLSTKPTDALDFREKFNIEENFRL